jgi:uncharacterized phiE125 gp8 family phage protein
MTLKLIAAPAAEPITLTEAKAHLRVDASTDDAIITAMIQAVREQAEHETGRALITQTWERVLDAFPAVEIELGRMPVDAISSIKYLDGTGAQRTLGSSLYTLDADTAPGWVLPVAGAAWPATADSANAVRVRFTAGYGASGAAVPAAVRAWMLLHLGALYRQREAFAAGQPVAPLPDRFVAALLDGVRVYA